LPFTLNEEQLWQLFGQCGQVDKVRLIRDRLTGIGKGFAYVQFRERSSVPLALELDGSMKCAGRLLRIQKCSAAGGPSNAKSSFEGAKSARLTGARLRLQRKTKTTPSATSTDNNVSPDKSRKRNRHDKQ
jgi:nucleolar protein 12